jgi:NAD(P)-dependent dehydrogenase (short-subunit alcohol dehydrogenase family)
VVCVDAVGQVPAEWGPDAYDTGIVARTVLDDVAREVDEAGPGQVLTIAADPFDQTSWERATAAAIEQLGRIDICCALMGTTGPQAGDGQLLDVSISSWQRCFDVNVLGPLLLSRACARDMVRRNEGGSIVILSSYSATLPPAGNGAIASARAAVNRVAEVLALEVGSHGIRVNTVLPLSVQSGDDRFPNPGLRRLATGQSDSLSSWVSASLPLGRPQSPDETAAAIEFLCSDESSFISGVSLPVAGGAHTHS